MKSQLDLYLRKRLKAIHAQIRAIEGPQWRDLMPEVYRIIEKLSPARGPLEGVTEQATGFRVLEDREIYKIYRKSFVKVKATNRMRARHGN